MFHSSSIHHFDLMFVVLCVIAGAISHTVSNSSKNSSNQKLQDHHQLSFIDLLLDGTLVDSLKSTDFSKNDIGTLKTSATRTFVDEENRVIHDFCAHLSYVLNENQIKICHKHYNLLESVLPQVLQITKEECVRITQDLKWNCPTLGSLLDGSNALAFTKEAALIRSILNASMMYLIVKTCSDHMHHSCGCRASQNSLVSTSLNSQDRNPITDLYIHSSNLSNTQNMTVGRMSLNHLELRKLETGSPLRLQRSMVHRQGCTFNTAFADALTKVFMDADDVKSLNKAYKIINSDSLRSRSGVLGKRIINSDQKDLSFIKWGKSALNLHNNQIGRQIVRDATINSCKCHGLSGMCQYQTCWDHLHDFKTITSKLREIYLNQNILVEVKNRGSYTHPDLYLAKSRTTTIPSCAKSIRMNMFNDISALSRNSDILQGDTLAYLYESPDFCDAQLADGLPGTKNRQCSRFESGERATQIHTKADFNAEDRAIQPSGTCEDLCCERGFYSQIVLTIVECNCRFRFCCKVECESCLRQQVQHYCR